MELDNCSDARIVRHFFHIPGVSLIGNPVKIGDGPAAVTLPFSKFSLEKGTLLAIVSHFSYMDGKAAKRAGESEDLSEQKALRPLKNANFCKDLT